MLPTLIGAANARVDTAHTGHEALERMRAARPDLLLLDLMMPEMGGAEVIAYMRSTPELADVATVVISAQDQLDHDLALHGELSLHKPDGFRLEDLVGTVEALLRALPPVRPVLGPAASQARVGPRQRRRLRAVTS
jgi:two-component system phosphate regulon response regulator PhoB